MKIKVLYSAKRKFKIGAELIKLFECTNYEHVSILMEDGCIYEAVLPSYRKISFFEWSRENIVKKEIVFDVSELEYSKAVERIKSMIGIKYSVMQLGLIFVENIAKIFIRPLGNIISHINLNNNRSLICTEAVLMVLKEIGLKFGESRDTISLRDFGLIVSQFKKERK